MKKIKKHKDIAVFGPDKKFISYCTKDRMFQLLHQNKAIRLNASSIMINQTNSDKKWIKHKIIKNANRVCYICKTKIPDNEIATVDHVVPKSRDGKADTYDNMRCCCSRCNNNKGNMLLSEYVDHILENRDNYDYISDKRLKYLKEFAKNYEANFYK